MRRPDFGAGKSPPHAAPLPPKPARANGSSAAAPVVRGSGRGGATGAAGTGTHDGVLAGVVRGTPVTGIVRHRFRGPQVLGAALLLAILGAPVLAMTGGSRMGPWVDATEVYAVAVLVALLALGRAAGTVIGDLAYSGRAFLPRRRAASAVPTPGAAAGANRARRRAPEHTTEVNRFRVEELDGSLHDCLIEGELRGGRLRDGDFVRATSIRRTRAGELRVRRVAVLSSANGVPVAHIAPAKSGAYAVARRVNRIAYGLAAVLVLGVAVGVALAW